MTEQVETRATRRPYQPPQLEQVQLVAEEAVLVGCKTRSTGGPDGNSCMPDIPPVMCDRPGT